tara:strand:+ start:457 stop:567 length:111 start_codon:yes stop_codon:yes gene_type:complete
MNNNPWNMYYLLDAKGLNDNDFIKNNTGEIYSLRFS